MPAAKASIYLATICYGGMAHAEYMASLLAVRPACAARGVALRIDLAGGEALVGRGRATLMAKFLVSDATHLLFAESDSTFAPDAIFALLEANAPVSRPDLAGGLLMIRRDAAKSLSDAHPELRAKLGDMSGLAVSEAVFVFDPLVEPRSGRYLADLDAFRARWDALAEARHPSRNGTAR